MLEVVLEALGPDRWDGLTLGAGHASGVATTPLGAGEVDPVVQAVGQGHLGTGAADAAHYHAVGAHLAGPVPRLLEGGETRSEPDKENCRWSGPLLLNWWGLRTHISFTYQGVLTHTGFTLVHLVQFQSLNTGSTGTVSVPSLMRDQVNRS